MQKNIPVRWILLGKNYSNIISWLLRYHIPIEKKPLNMAATVQYQINRNIAKQKKTQVTPRRARVQKDKWPLSKKPPKNGLKDL